jgi:hypothetical protein
VTPGPVARALAVVYALVAAAVVIGPAVAVRTTGARAGIEGEYDIDLLLASTFIGGAQAFIAWRRLVDEERMAERAIDVWIASIDALVVLAFCSTFLIAGVLLGFTDIHALLAARGAPVVLLWAGVQIVAVVLAELTGRGVYRLLEPDHPVHPVHPVHPNEPHDGSPPVAVTVSTRGPATSADPAAVVDVDAGPGGQAPPATACMIETVTPSGTGVSSPFMKRTSSSSTKTFT